MKPYMQPSMNTRTIFTEGGGLELAVLPMALRWLAADPDATQGERTTALWLSRQTECRRMVNLLTRGAQAASRLFGGLKQ